jgi:hypothetical protein
MAAAAPGETLSPIVMNRLGSLEEKVNQIVAETGFQKVAASPSMSEPSPLPNARQRGGEGGRRISWRGFGAPRAKEGSG